MRLLSTLIFSLCFAAIATDHHQDEQFCSRADLPTLCQNYEKCSQFGDLITEEIRDNLCPQYKTATPTPEQEVKTTASAEETTTGYSPDITTFATEELYFTTEEFGTEAATEQVSQFATDGYEGTTESPINTVTTPTIIRPPVNITVKPGDAGRFECTAKGAPSPQITITKKEDVIRPEFNGVFLGNARVQSQTAENLIKNVAKSNEGWYTCQACNPQGCVEHDAYLHVLDLCEGVTCPGLQECVGDYETGFGHTCECTLPCEPFSMIENAPVCTNYCEDKSNVCKMKLDSCLDNMLDVEVMSFGRCPDIEAPSILEDTILGDTEVEEGDDLSLSCFAEGTPEPTITWYHNGVVIGSGNVLMLTDITDDNAGEYKCVATNCMRNTATTTIAVVSVVPVVDQFLVDGPRSTCSVTGDPHFLTYDGFSYTYTGLCDNLLAMDCQSGSWFVYGRMTACGEGGSCLEAVTLYVGDESIEVQRGWLINRYGKKVVTKNRPGEVIEIQDSPHNITALYDGSNLRLTATLSQETVSASVIMSHKIVIDWDGYVGVHIQTPRATPTCGMCGNNDGVGDNEMVTRRGQRASSVEEFGDSWQIDPLGRCGSSLPTGDVTAVCGDKIEEVSRECESVFAAPVFTECRAAVGEEDTAHFVKTCMMDQCKGQYTPELEPRCVVAQAYAQRCGARYWREGNPLFYWGLRDWESAVGCPTPPEVKDVVVGTGCPQPATREEEATWVF